MKHRRGETGNDDFHHKAQYEAIFWRAAALFDYHQLQAIFYFLIYRFDGQGLDQHSCPQAKHFFINSTSDARETAETSETINAPISSLAA